MILGNRYTVFQFWRNHQVGTVKEVRGKRAIVLIGQLPMNVNLTDLVSVEKIAEVELGK
ncbi:MAG: MutS2/Smr-associated SH3 domain-containing protein [Bacteroidota bacterium]